MSVKSPTNIDLDRLTISDKSKLIYNSIDTGHDLPNEIRGSASSLNSRGSEFWSVLIIYKLRFL
jgi:hypothetical protein